MGIYNLPKEEQDKYNQDIDYKAFYEKTISQKVKRLTKTIAPQNGESLLLYISRAKSNLQALDEQQNQEHMYGPRGPWHVHKRAQNCFICDLSTNANQMLLILMEIIELFPNTSKTSFGMKEGSQRLVKKSKA